MFFFPQFCHFSSKFFFAKLDIFSHNLFLVLQLKSSKKTNDSPTTARNWAKYYVHFFYYVFREDLKKVSPNKQKVAACAKAPSNNNKKPQQQQQHNINGTQQPKWKRKKRLRWERRNKNRLMKSVYLKKGFSNCPHTKCPVVQQQKQQTGQTSVPALLFLLLLLSIREFLTVARRENFN